MELRKKELHMLRKKSEAQNQITFDEDFNVPDHKADIGQMIQKKGEVEIDQVQVSEGKAVIQGQLVFRLLYVADSPGRTVSSLEGKLPIEETLHLDEVRSGDKVCLKWEIEDLTIHLINSRKLNIKAIVEFFAVVDENTQVAVPVELKGADQISTKKKTIRVLTLGVHKKDILRKKEEITLASNKPNIHQILWKDIQVRGLEMRAQEGKVTARGELSVFVLYVSDDEANPLQWLEQTIPFSGELSCTGCTMDMIPYIDTTMLQSNLEIKPDADGEERVLLVDVVLELDMKLYQEETETILLDVYTPKLECIPQREPQMLEQLVVKNAAKCRVTEQLEIPESQEKILQICACEGTVRLEKYEPVENGIRAEGTITAELLYITTDDNMPIQSAREIYPFSQILEIPDMQPDVEAEMDCGLEQLSAVMMDQEHIEIKAVIQLNLMAFLPQKIQNIEEITEEPLDMEELQNRPGLVGYIAKAGDDLWTIAKENHTTIQDILETNGWTEKNLQPGDAVLIVKQIG